MGKKSAEKRRRRERPEPVIPLDEGIIGIWFIVVVPDEQDYMAGLYRENGELHLRWRFRYYADKYDPWDGRDKKNWYGGVLNCSEAEAIEKVRGVSSVLASTSGASGRGEYYEVLRGNWTLQQFTERFLSLPWVHAREMNEHGEYK